MSRTAGIADLHTGHNLYDEQNAQEWKNIDKQRQDTYVTNRMKDDEFSEKFNESKNKNTDLYSRQQNEIPAARAMLQLRDPDRVGKGIKNKSRKMHKRHAPRKSRKSHKRRASRKMRKSHNHKRH